MTIREVFGKVQVKKKVVGSVVYEKEDSFSEGDSGCKYSCIYNKKIPAGAGIFIFRCM
jgi:hypothetical protein